MVRITRREWLAAAGLALSAACRTKKGSGFPGFAVISNAGDSNLAVVDLTQFRLAKEVPVGAAATDILAGPRGETYALTPQNGTVHVLDPDVRPANSRKLAERVSSICLSADREALLAIAPDARKILFANAASLAIAGHHRLSAEPAFLAAPPQDDSKKPHYAAVSTGKHGSVELFDYSTGGHWQYDFDGEIGQVRFRADGQRLLVANLQERCISVLNTPGLQKIADLPVAMAPEHLCFNADEGQLFVSGAGTDTIAIIFPYSPLEVDQSVLGGREPAVMACSANPPYLFVGSRSGSEVCILNIDSRKVIGMVDAGQRPTYITVTPDSQYALLLDESAGTMAVIHIPAVAANAGNPEKWRNKATAGLFTMLQVGNQPLRAAVVRKTA